MWTYNNELYHYGVLGMKWGVRKAAKAAGRFAINHPSATSVGLGFGAIATDHARNKHIKNTYKPKYKSVYNKNAKTQGYVRAKKIDRLMSKKGISSRQADNTFIYGKRGAKRIEKRISRGDSPSRASTKEFPYMLGRAAVLSAGASLTIGVGLIAATPQGRRFLARGSVAAVKAMGSQVARPYRYARYTRYNKAVQLPNPKRRYVKAKWSVIN